MGLIMLKDGAQSDFELIKPPKTSPLHVSSRLSFEKKVEKK